MYGIFSQMDTICSTYMHRCWCDNPNNYGHVPYVRYFSLRWTQFQHTRAQKKCEKIPYVRYFMDMYRMFGIFLWGGHNCSILVHKKMWENTVRTVFFERDIIPEWIHRLHGAGRTQTQVEMYRMYGIFFQMGTIWSIWCWCFFRQTQFAAYGIGAKQACRLNTILKHTARTVAHSKAVLKSTVRTVFF